MYKEKYKSAPEQVEKHSSTPTGSTEGVVVSSDFDLDEPQNHQKNILLRKAD